MSTTWEKVGRAVADAAPILGGLLGGPAGGAAGALIASTLGSSSSPEAVLEKMKCDPEWIMKVQQLESDERKHLLDLQVQTLQAELADVQSARQAHAGHWMPSVLTVLLTVMVCAMTYAVITMVIPADNKDMAVYIFGVVTGAWSSSIAYWIGTSRTSFAKDAIIAGSK